MLEIVDQSALIPLMPKMVNAIHAMQSATHAKVLIYAIVVMIHLYYKLRNVSKSAVMGHIMQVVEVALVVIAPVKHVNLSLIFVHLVKHLRYFIKINVTTPALLRLLAVSVPINVLMENSFKVKPALIVILNVKHVKIVNQIV